MPQRLQVVSSALLLTQVSIDRHVAGSARQGFVLTIGNMLSRVAVNVLLGESEVYYVEDVLLSSGAPPDEEVLRLYISVY